MSTEIDITGGSEYRRWAWSGQPSWAWSDRLDRSRARRRRMWRAFLDWLRAPRPETPQQRIDRIPELRRARDEALRASMWRGLH